MLIVLLPEPLLAAGLESPPLYWWRLGREGGLLESGQDDLPALRRRYPAERLRLLAPATATNLYRVSIPVRRASAARAALPFALEDQLGQELEELHLVAGPRRADGRYVAAVTEHRCMQEWMQLVEAAGWRADAMLPQGSLHQDQTPERGLRIQPSPWPNGPSTVLVTSVDQEPVLIEQELLGFWLKQRLGQLDEDQRRVQLIGLTPEQLGIDADCEVDTAVPASLEAALLASLQPARSLNLLTGGYSSGMAAPPWRKLRPALVAAGVLLAVLIAQQGIQTVTLNKERDRLQAQIDQLFDETLPRSRRVDPVTQFRQVLEGASGQAAADGMGVLLHDALAAVAAEGSAKILQFRATPAELELELSLPSFAELEKLRSQLAASAGLSESLQGADSDGEGVTARLRIQRNPS